METRGRIISTLTASAIAVAGLGFATPSAMAIGECEIAVAPTGVVGVEQTINLIHCSASNAVNVSYASGGASQTVAITQLPGDEGVAEWTPSASGVATLTLNADPVSATITVTSPSPSPVATPSTPPPWTLQVVARNVGGVMTCPADWILGGWEAWSGAQVCYITTEYNPGTKQWSNGTATTLSQVVAAWGAEPVTPYGI